MLVCNASGGYGYLDGAGRVVVEPAFQRTFDFSGGRARAVADQTTGLIDTAGNWVLPPGEFLRIEISTPFPDRLRPSRNPAGQDTAQP